MKIGIIGANGQVGTELCLLLANRDDATPIPIVRNRLGSHFLRHDGIDCRIADIASEEDASNNLIGLDVIVIAAFAWQYSHEGFQARGARRANEAIVTNAVDQAPNGARVIYLSSQAAYGNAIDAPQYSTWSLYTREKRNAESLLRTRCDETDTPSYILRLGFVHGPNQGRTAELREALSTQPYVHIYANPEKPSNVLHTVTLLDAILACGREDVEPGTYGLVNEPQWTWRDVCDYYAQSGVTLHFAPPGEGDNLLSSVLGKLWGLIESRQRTLRTLTLFVPDNLNERLFNEYLKHQRGNELTELEERVRLERSAFEFAPIPGERITNLPETRSRLDAIEAIEDVLTTQHQT